MTTPLLIARVGLFLCLPLWLLACSDDGQVMSARDDPMPIETSEREALAAALLAPREDLALAGTRWQAEAFVDSLGGKLPLSSELVYTLVLADDGSNVGGFDGCNAHQRTWERAGTALRISAIVGSDAAVCELSDTALLEQALTGRLIASTSAFEIRGDRLWLVDPDGRVLVLRGQPDGEVNVRHEAGVDPEFADGESIPFSVLEVSAGLNLGADAVSVPQRLFAAYDPQGFTTLWNNARSHDTSLPPPDFNFDIGTVVGVFSPLRPTLGYGIGIDAIVRDGGITRVFATTILPGMGCNVAQAMSVPYVIVGVPTVIASPLLVENVAEAEACT